MALPGRRRLATEAVAIAANRATATTDGMTVTCDGELVNVISLPKMPSNSTASQIVTMLTVAQNPGNQKPGRNALANGRAGGWLMRHYCHDILLSSFSSVLRPPVRR